MTIKSAAVITTDDKGVHVSYRGARAELQWDAIRRVLAFKRDELVTDLVCLRIEGGDSQIELNEEMEGWQRLLETLPNHLAGSLPRHKVEEAVVHPPFAMRETVVYDRDAA